MPNISIPTPLRIFADGESRAAVSAQTVGDALGELSARFPRLASQLLAPDGNLRRFVNVFVNADNIRDLDGLTTHVAERDEVTIIPSIAGG
jgi:molybdopterin converting factor small subunit